MHRLIVAIALLLSLGGCLTPPEQAAASITISEDLRFEATPPIGFPTYKVYIAKGRYRLFKHDMAYFYYASEQGAVSRGLRDATPEVVQGGIGIDRSNGRYFVWKRDTAVGGVFPVGAALVYSEGGREIQTFLAGIPRELEAKLIVER